MTYDIDLESTTLARKYFTQSPHGSKIDLRLGPALETLRQLKGPFDLVFIDVDKLNYIKLLSTEP